jgi:very-short-patch-repair endonuclease
LLNSFIDLYSNDTSTSKTKKQLKFVSLLKALAKYQDYDNALWSKFLTDIRAFFQSDSVDIHNGLVYLDIFLRNEIDTEIKYYDEAKFDMFEKECKY